jgi:hypothetical protein
MLALAELQRRMRDVVLGASADSLRGVVADDRLGHARRLNVYRNNTAILLRDALATHFPVTAQLVGDAYFANLAQAFVRTHPPRSPCLFEYGDAFADFIATFPSAQTLPYLTDVARLEWARVSAVHAADAAVLSPAQLSRIAAEDYSRLCFAPHPATRIVTSPYPIHAIWTLHQTGADPHASVHLDTGGEAVLITRARWEVQVNRLSSGEDVFMMKLFGGATLEVAFAAAQAQNDAFDAARALSTILTSGIFTSHALN